MIDSQEIRDKVKRVYRDKNPSIRYGLDKQAPHLNSVLGWWYTSSGGQKILLGVDGDDALAFLSQIES